MTEEGLRAVTLLQAFETAAPPSPHWSAADRAWATHVARETADAREAAARAPAAATARGRGARAMHRVETRRAAVAIERRARLGLQRLASRDAAVQTQLADRAPAARFGRLPAAALLLLGLALAAGIVADAVGAGRQIDLLAPPLWGVVAWNLVVYLGLLTAAWRRPAGGTRRAGPIRRGMLRLVDAVATLSAPRGPDADSEAAWRGFRQLWLVRSAPLWTARAGAVLHAAAALFAVGLIAGLYLRGLVLDYRAGWESTFLDAETVRTALGVLLAPAAALDAIALPDAAGFAAMRGVHGSGAGAAPAAPWIHLLATTLGLIVVLPRVLLTAGAAAGAAWRRGRLVLGIAGDAYLEQLARELAGRTARAVAVPYASRPAAGSAAALAEALRDELGAAASVRLAPSVAYGDEDDPLPLFASGTTHVLALFDLAATPEAEAHGRFAAALARAAAPLGASVRLVVDEARFVLRFATEPARRSERRAAWQRWADTLGLPLVFVELVTPPDAAGPADARGGGGEGPPRAAAGAARSPARR